MVRPTPASTVALALRGSEQPGQRVPIDVSLASANSLNQLLRGAAGHSCTLMHHARDTCLRSPPELLVSRRQR
ncbi:hypothetical protein RB9747 [Rhodopirellula baltica SH 1]|uniref:Uncharacterized protein n=1 Tax=Rhodopirellula baltica (strain DSM 10527 / NCIMB 13988 / SH1) TaxID=243090 RepID=Q7UL44_RHOBA|nr:hypothetical protein RB9747 [Rhodopirellula baltica SH 1]